MTVKEALEILDAPIILCNKDIEIPPRYIEAFRVIMAEVRKQEETTWHYCPYCGKRLDVH